MTVSLLPTVRRGHEACVAVPTAVYIHEAASAAMYGGSSPAHLLTYYLYMDGEEGE